MQRVRRHDPRLEIPLDPAATDAAPWARWGLHHERLLKTPAARRLPEAVDLFEEAISFFRLGFSDRTLGLRLPHGNRQEGEAIRKRLQKLGIYRENGREHLNGRIVLPLPTAAGHYRRLYGRLIGKPNPGVKPHIYSPGPHEGIWNVDALKESELILCEAAFDALTFGERVQERDVHIRDGRFTRIFAAAGPPGAAGPVGLRRRRGQGPAAAGRPSTAGAASGLSGQVPRGMDARIRAKITAGPCCCS